MDKIESFFASLMDKNVGLIGLGVSHSDLAELLLNKGINVTIFDKKTRNELPEIANSLENKGVKFVLGESYLDDFSNVDIIFRTPGMYFYSEPLQNAIKNGKIVTSETEVFFDLCPCKIYANTGTDGKTTTTTIMSEMLKKSGRKVHLGGNIGRALLPMIEEISSEDVAVVELSSFQLISMRKSPDVALITNIYPDHLNVHKDMAEYVGAKKNLISHQNAFSKTILNFDNEGTFALRDDVRGQLYGFSCKNIPEIGSFLDNEGFLCFNNRGVSTKLFHKSEIRIPGNHNVENYLAAISALFGDVSVEDMRFVAQNFGGVEHRIEFVRELNGVKYYNDSIATSPVSVIAGLKSFGQKIIVIAGGSDKKLDYNTMSSEIIEFVKTLILTGETADKIETAVKSNPNYNEENCVILRANGMEDAVNIAHKMAENGDIVTLSPASASFDCYKNFEERGKHYKSIVGNLV